MTRRELLSRLGIAGLVAALPAWAGGPQRVRYWLTHGDGWEAHTEDTTRHRGGGGYVRMSQCETPEEAERKLLRMAEAVFPGAVLYRKEPMPTRLIRVDGKPGPWIMSEPW